jgi:hypothetical protein
MPLLVALLATLGLTGTIALALCVLGLIADRLSDYL